MDFIISDEVSSEVTKLDKIKKDNKSNLPTTNKPVFLTKEERENRMKEELLKKLEEEKLKEKRIQEMRSQYLHQCNYKINLARKDRSRSRSRRRNSSKSRSKSRDRKRYKEGKHKRSISSDSRSNYNRDNEEPLINDVEINAIKVIYNLPSLSTWD
jgi:hypothetical protein